MPKVSAAAVLFAAAALAGCTFELTGPPAAASIHGVCASGDKVCAGRVLAESRCARCHAIGFSGTSPYPGAQPFRVFWQRWTRPALASALKTGIIAEHDQSGVKLPEMKLEENEIGALFAYLDTVQEK
jgi:mono/diheme cytochrome c family protein